MSTPFHALPAAETASPPAHTDRAPATSRRASLLALARNPFAMAGAVLLVLMVILAFSAPWLYPGDPLDMVAPPLLWPGQDARFPLGSDSLGRDVAAGLAHGARVSLAVGVVAAALSLLIGIVVGAAAGYFGGLVDDVLVRITELFQTVPSFLFVVVVVAIGQPSVPVIVLAIGLASWPVIARLVRAEFRALREAEFILAARSQGFGHLRIIVQELLPNALPPVIVTTSVLVASAILIESGLSFLGMGDPNAVSWGSMIGEGRELLRTAWYLTALPGLAIVLTVLALNLLGDGLNDAFNPRLRGR
ncbi:ABC transporter permease [Paracidovorax cattleyae]|uniref:Peptide/nickel transport system permease protein n=1 Tax=Paracidovorax cattleyae TaxID=80868 RepID=A0A1H0LKB8_9BURK|nr:ABC transporter permease [Paracidovorax cattleyae]MBF9263885.1 ABC transporter permease [Paracidovorax cattleyae]SDO68632.1 peptide/nickel transport system permease protein [Paracidovorax cattleyae]